MRPLPGALAIVAMAASPVIVAADSAGLASLGEYLFFDTNLSAHRTQACASCHDPAKAFTDSRNSGSGGAVSLGDDGESLGDRNAPTITYAALIPEFGTDADGEYAGGVFYDGRATNLLQQAGQPFTRPGEMAMPAEAAVVARVREEPLYVGLFEKYFGDSIFDDTDAAFLAIRQSLVAYESTAAFASFDSKYDRSLRGEYQLTADEELGRQLFYSQLFNCHRCHLLDTREYQPGEAFSNHRYHNIGVPVNLQVRRVNGLGASRRDLGLLENPAVDDPAEAGKFKVPTLRNVAVTGPYMHNGVFKDLKTVVLFYNKFTLSNTESQTNPETGESWGEPEVPETVDLDLLRQGQPISSMQLSAIVAFLEALTDKRYEGLLRQ